MKTSFITLFASSLWISLFSLTAFAGGPTQAAQVPTIIIPSGSYIWVRDLTGEPFSVGCFRGPFISLGTPIDLYNGESKIIGGINFACILEQQQ